MEFIAAIISLLLWGAGIYGVTSLYENDRTTGAGLLLCAIAVAYLAGRFA